ncbi:MAG: TPM domain-containing protein [Candidatus Symbiothrix sp.]|jgi:uncharacterized protein|nr:TPM domain-containing protein [Candidatus Symbiothrix sp.]
MKQFSTILIFALCTCILSAQNIPDKPDPPRLVNDLAHVLTSEQVAELENELDTYARSTTTQIVVLTVPSLNGYDVSDFAFKVGEKWGVGQKDGNNGVVIVFKPKTDNEMGKVFVAVGYGLEGVIPDAIANREIVNREMLPRFRENDVYGGLLQACKVIMSLASKEFTPQEYEESGGDPAGAIVFIVFFCAVIFFMYFAAKNSRKNYTMSADKSNLPLWMLLSSLNSGKNSGNSWSDFSSGGGHFGGGGGFGGFGGGHFGGGGAGGSW